MSLNIANRLGIGHGQLNLYRNRSTEWRSGKNGSWQSIEAAALDHFLATGWSGCIGEGGAILNLMKIACFRYIPSRYKLNFVEGFFHPNFVESNRKSLEKMQCYMRKAPDIFRKKSLLTEFSFLDVCSKREVLLQNIDKCDSIHIKKMFRDMLKPVESDMTKTILISDGNYTLANFFPYLRESHLLGLFENLGVEKLKGITEIFMTDSYEYRKGWPDLTLWRDSHVKFVEVKGPGDSLRKSQKKIISDILKPLNLDIMLLDVKAVADNSP